MRTAPRRQRPRSGTAGRSRRTRYRRRSKTWKADQRRPGGKGFSSRWSVRFCIEIVVVATGEVRRWSRCDAAGNTFTDAARIPPKRRRESEGLPPVTVTVSLSVPVASRNARRSVRPARTVAFATAVTNPGNGARLIRSRKQIGKGEFATFGGDRRSTLGTGDRDSDSRETPPAVSVTVPLISPDPSRLRQAQRGATRRQARLLRAYA